MLCVLLLVSSAAAGAQRLIRKKILRQWEEKNTGKNRRAGGHLLRTAAVFCAFAAAGSIFYAAAERPDALETRLLGEPGEEMAAQVSGRISDIQENSTGWAVTLRCAAVTADGVRYPSGGVIWQTEDVPQYRVGSAVRLTGTLGFFPRASNPGCFDRRADYRARGIRFRLREARAEAAEGIPLVWSGWLWTLRRALHEGIARAADPQDAGMLQAIFLGESAEAPTDQKELFRAAGIAHLLAVSGLHVLFAGMAVYRLTRRLTGSFFAAEITGSLSAAVYGALTGNSIPAVRAVLMVVVMSAAASRGRIYDSATACGAAAIASALTCPLKTATASFLLSYAAVFGMSVLSESWQAWLLRGSRGNSGLLSLLSMQQAILPFTLWFFYEYPPYALLLNQLILPFAGWLLGCAAGCAVSGCLGFTRMAGIFRGISHGILVYYRALCGLCRRLPGASRTTGRPAAWRMIAVFALAAAFVFLSRRAAVRRKRKDRTDPGQKAILRRQIAVTAASFTVIFFLGFFLHADPPRQLRITMLDVGQGDSVLIEFAGGGSILSDGGSTSESGCGKYILEPVLQSRGIRRLSGILLSHADADHVNGVIQLLMRGNVTAGWIGIPDTEDADESFQKVTDAAREKGIPVLRLSDGMEIRAGDTALSILHPQAGKEYADTNAGSLCFALRQGDFCMLFTGDLPSSEEDDLDEFSAPEDSSGEDDADGENSASGEDCADGENSPSGGVRADGENSTEGESSTAGSVSPQTADILKVPHHGSRYSTSAAWLAVIRPQVALISCGRGNSYGHPHEETLRRLSETGARIFVTESAGAVTVTVGESRYQITTFAGAEEEEEHGERTGSH